MSANNDTLIVGDGGRLMQALNSYAPASKIVASDDRGATWRVLSEVSAKALPTGESWSDSFEELARDRFIIGDPARVREEIARYRDRLGATTLTLRLQWPGMEQAKVLRSIRLLGEQVFPHFR